MLPKDQWIELYALQLMASYSAKEYDDNCARGWRDKEKFMPPEEAYHLAEKAWNRFIEFEPMFK